MLGICDHSQPDGDTQIRLRFKGFTARDEKISCSGEDDDFRAVGNAREQKGLFPLQVNAAGGPHGADAQLPDSSVGGRSEAAPTWQDGREPGPGPTVLTAPPYPFSTLTRPLPSDRCYLSCRVLLDKGTPRSSRKQPRNLCPGDRRVLSAQ